MTDFEVAMMIRAATQGDTKARAWLDEFKQREKTPEEQLRRDAEELAEALEAVEQRIDAGWEDRSGAVTYAEQTALEARSVARIALSRFRSKYPKEDTDG